MISMISMPSVWVNHCLSHLSMVSVQGCARCYCGKSSNEYEEENPDVIKFSLIGRPNVGKSSLINAILGEDRVIASPVAGTTRDAIDTHFTDTDGQEFTMIDTAGMRKSGKVYENTEKYSVMRAMRAIDRSDVVLMVINAEEGIP